MNFFYKFGGISVYMIQIAATSIDYYFTLRIYVIIDNFYIQTKVIK